MRSHHPIYRHLSVFAAFLAAGMVATSARVFSNDSIKALIDSRPIDPIEGIWQWPDDGATIAIIAAGSGAFEMIVIDSPDMAVAPGTIMGRVTRSARKSLYDARIMSRVDSDGKMSHHKKFSIDITDPERLSVEPYQKGKSISLWRWIPYIFRMTINSRDTSPAGIDGAVRIYPETYATNPRYL